MLMKYLRIRFAGVDVFRQGKTAMARTRFELINEAKDGDQVITILPVTTVLDEQGTLDKVVAEAHGILAERLEQLVLELRSS